MEPLSGYLLLGQQLLKGQSDYADAWNFGPRDTEILTVKDVVSLLKDNWNS